jgi:hypothetical protein
MCPETGASAWRESAHALHGVALSIGAIRLSQMVAGALEREGPDQAQSYVGEFAKYLSEVRDVLAAFLL